MHLNNVDAQGTCRELKNLRHLNKHSGVATLVGRGVARDLARLAYTLLPLFTSAYKNAHGIRTGIQVGILGFPT